MKTLRYHNCRVCGYYISNPPWGYDNQTPTYEICSCCGVEFGNEDYCLLSIIRYRKEWKEKGMPWFERKLKPSNWSFEIQKREIPDKWQLNDVK